MTRRPCLTALIPSALLLALSALGEAHRALWEHGQLASRYQVSREAFARWMRRSGIAPPIPPGSAGPPTAMGRPSLPSLAMLGSAGGAPGVHALAKEIIMAADYRLSRWRRLLNQLVRALLLVGLGPRHTYLLTVRGRRSGRPYSTPVTLVEEGEQRWLVAPYGEVNWVRNVRAAGRIMLSRGRHTESVAIVEVGSEEAAPVLKRYISEVPITRPYFGVRPDASLDAFRAEAPQHPVFRLIGETG